jgi:helix-turn-helix protein
VQLSDTEARVLSLLDGSLERSEISAQTAVSETELATILARLAYAGLLLH